MEQQATIPVWLLPLHGEFIEVIILLRVSHIDPFLNLTIKQLPGLVIDTAVIGIHVIPN